MEVKLEITYITPKGTIAPLISDFMRVEKALLIMEDMEKTGRIKHIVIIDQHDTTWTIKEIKKYLQKIETEPHNVTVYFDGGFNRDTKKSGLGSVIYYKKNGKSYRLRKNAEVEQLDTNNEAEYAALHLALQELELLGVHHIPVTFVGDSQVVINQMKGEWPVYEKELLKWADKLDSKLESQGIQPTYELISRKKNREADQLATQALEGIEITSEMEMSKE